MWIDQKGTNVNTITGTPSILPSTGTSKTHFTRPAKPEDGPSLPSDAADINFSASTASAPPRKSSESKTSAKQTPAPAAQPPRPSNNPTVLPMLDDPPAIALTQAAPWSGSPSPASAAAAVATNAAAPTPAAWISQLSVSGPVGVFSTPTPEGLKPFTDFINGAQHSLKMAMFHITDPGVAQALIQAKDRLGADNVQVLLDGASIAANNGQNSEAKIYQQLEAAGVNCIKSSPAFSITHEKSMVADAGTPQAKALISSVNMTKLSTTTRDYGITTTDPGIINEFDSVFSTDIANAKNGTGNTPPLSNPNLVWSPTDSESKLVDIINSAANSQYSLSATTESLSDPAIMAALQAAAGRGVNIQMIVPEYVEGPPSTAVFNYPALKTLNATEVAGSGHDIQAHVMPYPATATTPYMHGKMMLVQGPDGDLGYLGSVNFSANSTDHAREVGFVFNDKTAPAVVQQLKSDFATDWKVSIPPPANPTPPADS